MRISKFLFSAGVLALVASCAHNAQAQPGGSVDIIQPVTAGHCALFKESNQNHLYDGGPCSGSGGGVSSFNGRTGTVVPANNDYSFSQINGSLATTQLPALVGDITSSAGGNVTVLATVNSNVGTFGDATHCAAFSVNAKGLVTAASQGTSCPGGGSTGANPSATIGAAAVNGVATTYMRSDGAPALPATLPALSGVNLTALNASNISSGTLAAARGGFAADISSSSGVPFFAAGVVTFTSTSGTGNFARVTSPTFVTPTLGAALATSINGVAFSSLIGNTTALMSAIGSFVSGNGVASDVNHNLVDLGYAPGPQGTGVFITSGISPTMTDYNVGCKWLTVNGSSQTVNLPTLSSPQAGGCYFLNTPFNQSVTVHPAGSDLVNGANSNVTVAANLTIMITADASAGWGVPIGPSGGGGVSSLAGTANQITASASTGAVTLSIPSAFTFPGTVLMGQAGATSAPAFKMTGAPFAGTGTTSMPLFDINVSGATARTGQSTGGTMFGMNAANAFSGNLMDLSVGGASVFSISSGGNVSANLVSGNIDAPGTGFIDFSARALLRSPVDGSLDVKFQNDTTFGNVEAAAYVVKGATPTITGTATTGTKVGGQTAGTFVETATAQTVILTFLFTAPNGWYCEFKDRTTPADLINQTASSTTSCTAGTHTTAASDVIQWRATPY